MLNLHLYKEHFDEVILENHKIARWKIVCPSPQRSDLYRNYLIKKGLANKVEAITVAKFLSDHLTLEEGQKKLSKSELMVDLWTFWKASVNDDYEKFHFCFELFTEVRSFNLTGELIEELTELKTLEKECIAGLMQFHRYLDTFNIVDEQKSYQLVGEQFRPEEGIGYIFIGFDHLNANQIDMLKGMGEKAEVFVPINAEVFALCDNKVYWPNWIETQKIKFSEEVNTIECRFLSIPQGRSAEYLSDLITDDKQLLTFSSGLDLTQVNSVLIRDKRFKTDFALFFTCIDQVINKVQEQLNLNQGVLSVDKLQEYLNDLSRLYLNDTGFMMLKTILSLKKELKDFSDKATINEQIYNSDLKLIKEVLGLNLPRTSVVNIAHSDKGAIGTRDDLLISSHNEDTYLFITKDDLGSLTSSQRFSNDVLVIFSGFGPLQTKNLDIVSLRIQLRKFIVDGGKLILEEGLTHGSTIAETLFEKIHLIDEHLESQSRLNFQLEYLDKTEVPEKLSPSYIQTYMDCPKKWQLKYAQRVDLDVSSSAFIDRRYIGTVNHNVIEAYLENHHEFNEKILKELITLTFNQFVKDNSLHPEKIDVESLKLAVESYCKRIIKQLLVVKAMPDTQLIFERDISKENDKFKGFIDLLIKQGNDFYIYDFKTSKGAIPSKSDITSFKKIQLLAYFKAWGQKHTFKGGGYICLEDLNESMIIGEDKFFTGYHSKSKMIESVDMDEFGEFIEDKIKEMKEAVSWPALPSSTSVCSFCVANPVCAKGEVR